VIRGWRSHAGGGGRTSGRSLEQRSGVSRDVPDVSTALLLIVAIPDMIELGHLPEKHYCSVRCSSESPLPLPMTSRQLTRRASTDTLRPAQRVAAERAAAIEEAAMRGAKKRTDGDTWQGYLEARLAALPATMSASPPSSPTRSPGRSPTGSPTTPSPVHGEYSLGPDSLDMAAPQPAPMEHKRQSRMASPRYFRATSQRSRLM